MKCPNDGNTLQPRRTMLFGKPNVYHVCELCDFTVPSNNMSIDQVYVFVSVDDKGLEGIIGIDLPGFGRTPAMSADIRIIDKHMRPMIESMTNRTGYKAKLLKFSNREIVESFGGE